MITRRSILVASPAILLVKPGICRPPLFRGGSIISGGGFTPDGTRINAGDSSVINSAWGRWTLPYLFTPGLSYIYLNGRPYGYTASPQSGFPGSPQWGVVPSTYWLEINDGGNIYAFPNGDTGVCAATSYGSFIPNNVTTAPPCPCAITGPGISFPNYFNPPFGPPYTPSSDGSSITAPTSSTLTTIDGIWGLQGTNATYGGANVMLNGIGFCDNRGAGNTDTGPGVIVGATTLKVANHGQPYALLPDGFWRCLTGLQCSPAAGDPGSGSLPVPTNLLFTSAGSFSYPAIPATSPSHTLIGSLSMPLSDGTTRAPADSEMTIDATPSALAATYTSPQIFSLGTQTAGTATGMVLQVTVNGSSFCLTFTVYYY